MMTPQAVRTPKQWKTVAGYDGFIGVRDVSCEQPLGSAAACLCKHTNWRPKEPTRNIRTAEGCRNQRRLSDGTEPSAELKVT